MKMSKSDFDKLTTLVLFSFAYVVFMYVLWNFVTLPAVLHFGDDIAARDTFSCTFDEVLANVLLVHLLFCATKLGKNKEIK
jgi:hypothetical protein